MAPAGHKEGGASHSALARVGSGAGAVIGSKESPRGSKGSPRQSTAIHGNPRQSTAIHGNPRQSTVGPAARGTRARRVVLVIARLRASDRERGQTPGSKESPKKESESPKKNQKESERIRKNQKESERIKKNQKVKKESEIIRKKQK